MGGGDGGTGVSFPDRFGAAKRWRVGPRMTEDPREWETERGSRAEARRTELKECGRPAHREGALWAGRPRSLKEEPANLLLDSLNPTRQ